MGGGGAPARPSPGRRVPPRTACAIAQMPAPARAPTCCITHPLDHPATPHPRRYRCDACKALVAADKYTRLEAGPHHLQICLKRFAVRARRGLACLALRCLV